MRIAICDDEKSMGQILEEKVKKNSYIAIDFSKLIWYNKNVNKRYPLKGKRKERENENQQANKRMLLRQLPKVRRMPSQRSIRRRSGLRLLREL